MHYEFLSQFTKTLNNLSAILDKAEGYAQARKIEPTTLLTARLYPDQFAFTRQVQLACDVAKNYAVDTAQQTWSMYLSKLT